MKKNPVSGSDGNVREITRFEKVHADEERLIKDLQFLLQEKMSKDYPEGKSRRGAHPKTLVCLQAEFIAEPDILRLCGSAAP